LTISVLALLAHTMDNGADISAELPLIDLDVFRTHPKDSQIVLDECKKVGRV